MGIAKEFKDDVFSEGFSDFYGMYAKNKSFFRGLVRDSRSFFFKYMAYLPAIDQDISYYYYIEGLTQTQISKMYSISQSATSSRLKKINERIKFLFKFPNLNPIQVRIDFELLFPSRLFEFAYIFYWEATQQRVQYYMETTQVVSAKKFSGILEHLDCVSMGTVSIFDKDISDFTDTQLETRKYLAMVYLDFFRVLNERSNMIAYVFRRDYIPSDSRVMDGVSVI